MVVEDPQVGDRPWGGRRIRRRVRRGRRGIWHRRIRAWRRRRGRRRRAPWLELASLIWANSLSRTCDASALPSAISAHLLGARYTCKNSSVVAAALRQFQSACNASISVCYFLPSSRVIDTPPVCRLDHQVVIISPVSTIKRPHTAVRVLDLEDSQLTQDVRCVLQSLQVKDCFWGHLDVLYRRILPLR